MPPLDLQVDVDSTWNAIIQKFTEKKKRLFCRSLVCCVESSHLSVSRDTQPWFALLAKLFLLKGCFSSSGCRKNFLDASMTRSTFSKHHGRKDAWHFKHFPQSKIPRATLLLALLTSSRVIPVFLRKTNPTSVKAAFSSWLRWRICSSVTSSSLRLYAPKSTTGMLILRFGSVTDRSCKQNCRIIHNNMSRAGDELSGAGSSFGCHVTSPANSKRDSIDTKLPNTCSHCHLWMMFAGDANVAGLHRRTTQL